MSKKNDWKLDSPEFEFEMKALMKDKAFMSSLREEWDRLEAEGRQDKDIMHIIEMKMIRKVGERIENPPEDPSLN